MPKNPNAPKDSSSTRRRRDVAAAIPGIHSSSPPAASESTAEAEKETSAAAPVDDSVGHQDLPNEDAVQRQVPDEPANVDVDKPKADLNGQAEITDVELTTELPVVSAAETLGPEAIADSGEPQAEVVADSKGQDDSNTGGHDTPKDELPIPGKELVLVEKIVDPVVDPAVLEVREKLELLGITFDLDRAYKMAMDARGYKRSANYSMQLPASWHAFMGNLARQLSILNSNMSLSQINRCMALTLLENMNRFIELVLEADEKALYDE